jgi:hypothetical protein
MKQAFRICKEKMNHHVDRTVGVQFLIGALGSFSSVLHPKQILELLSLLSTQYQGIFPRNMKLTTYFSAASVEITWDFSSMSPYFIA